MNTFGLSHSFVYFIKDHTRGMIKIGRSSRPLKRGWQILQKFGGEIEILATIKILAAPLETSLHSKFKQHCVEGEWFSLSKEIEEFILLHAEPWKQEQPKNVSFAREVVADIPGSLGFNRDALKAIRIERGLSMDSAAKMVGYASRQRWEQLESGVSSASLKTINRIAKAFAINPIVLVRNTSDAVVA